jgi:hypothetical protein
MEFTFKTGVQFLTVTVGEAGKSGSGKGNLELISNLFYAAISASPLIK